MLHEFIELNRDAIIGRTRDRVRSRPWPSVAPGEVEHGVPLFLTQLAETLRLETTSSPFPADAIGAAAARHGRDLLRSGFTVSQVVHDYGDICQTITALAVEQRAPITVEEFHTLNRCLDTAIAEAVTEHARGTAASRSACCTTPSRTPHRGGSVVLRARAEEGRLLIETEDECGGLPQGKSDLFQVFGDRRGSDRSGLGLGLSIVRKAVRAHGGEIRIRNMPGKSCVFTIEVPLAADEPVPQAVP